LSRSITQQDKTPTGGLHKLSAASAKRLLQLRQIKRGYPDTGRSDDTGNLSEDDDCSSHGQCEDIDTDVFLARDDEFEHEELDDEREDDDITDNECRFSTQHKSRLLIVL